MAAVKIIATPIRAIQIAASAIDNIPAQQIKKANPPAGYRLTPT